MVTNVQRMMDFIAAQQGYISAADIAKGIGIDANSITAMVAPKYKEGKLLRCKVKGKYCYRTVHPTLEPVRRPAAAPPPPPKPTIDIDEMVDKISDEIVDMIINKINEKLSERLGCSMPVVMTAAKKAIETAQKTKVLVVGLLPQQAGLIQQEFGDKFNMDFCEATTASGKLRSQVLASDIVVTMTKFISHSHQDITLSAGGNLRRCAGGLSQLRAILTEVA